MDNDVLPTNNQGAPSANGPVTFGGAAQPEGKTPQAFGIPYAQSAAAQANAGFPTPAAGSYPQQSGTAPQREKSSRGPIAAIIILGLIALIVFGMYSCVNAVGNMGGSYASSSFGANTVAVINIDGTIQYDGTQNSPEGLKTLLDQAKSDDNVKAVVLRVNSGGGSATAGEEMTNLVKEFDKPVVVSSASLNASAAYMISAQSDYIFVDKTTEIGSIGVVMQTTDLSGLLEKLGVGIENITSADSKDSTYGTRPLTDEERAYYQKMVDDINDLFIEWVAEGRSMSEDEVRPLATGLVYLGVDAVQNGLADEIGSKDDACTKAAELANLDWYSVDNLELPSSELKNLLGLAASSQSADNLTAQKIIDVLKELENNDSVVR